MDLDQHAQLKFAAPGNLEGVLLVGLGDLHRDVGFGFAQKALADHPALHLVAVAAGQGAVVHRDGDGDGGRVDGLRRQGALGLQRADGIGHGGLGQAGHGDDIARRGLVDGLALEAAEGQQLADPAAFHLHALARQGADRHAGNQLAGFHAAGEQAAQERIGLDQNRQQLRRRVGAALRLGGRNVLDDHVEERGQILVLVLHLHHGPALLAAGVDVRKVKLLVVGADGGEEVEGVVQHLVRVGVRPVDLVEHHDGLQAQLQRLAEHELGLGHDAFLGVHQQQAAVHHAQDPLHLAAEVGVARGVDDVDSRLAGRAVPEHRGGLGQDGDPALALLVVGVHGPFDVRLIGAEHAGLRQHLVHQGGLAMIDVGDDGDIAQGHGGGGLPLRDKAVS